ncbi:hypothetical protein [Saccharothrix yanglingensis]|uniref:Uncharacterized protein n=1 Tax=Saccharothrix yanglingensis TaxID=659496 RepID=A0ABU0WYZ6_9PSEU|nr:hypothetical protein [Saccharothrix yanglingensis]MDQ2584597.1 hypothetical protein [Saccharothrix yanglingensis]
MGAALHGTRPTVVGPTGAALHGTGHTLPGLAGTALRGARPTGARLAGGALRGGLRVDVFVGRVAGAGVRVTDGTRIVVGAAGAALHSARRPRARPIDPCRRSVGTRPTSTLLLVTGVLVTLVGATGPGAAVLGLLRLVRLLALGHVHHSAVPA